NARPVSLGRRIALQFAAILGLSTALGYIFNAASPIGVRFENASSATELRTSPATNFSLLTTSSVPVQKRAPVPQPPLPQSAVAQSSPALPPVKIPLTPVAPTATYTLPPIVISNLPPPPAPATATAAAAVAPTN